jgi:hypothetical protein
MDVDVITTLSEAAAKWGLGIVLAIMMMIIFILVLKKLIASTEKQQEAYIKAFDENRNLFQGESEKDRKMFLSLLKSKDETINNHLDHVNDSLLKMEKSQASHGQILEKIGKDITEEISNQTKMMSNTLPCMRIKNSDNN